MSLPTTSTTPPSGETGDIARGGKPDEAADRAAKAYDLLLLMRRGFEYGTRKHWAAKAGLCLLRLRKRLVRAMECPKQMVSRFGTGKRPSDPLSDGFLQRPWVSSMEGRSVKYLAP